MKRLHDYENIILASKSPRRLDILHAHGIDPIVVSADADESLESDTGMVEAVKELARRKAHAALSLPVIREYCDTHSGAPCDSDKALMIAADTIVYNYDLGIMGKPADSNQAFQMLSSIRNSHHYVATGVTLIELPSLQEHTFADVTVVYCKDYSDDEIREYIDTSEPYDKAGGYAIQGKFGKHIDHITGLYENVVGLPYDRIVRETTRNLSDMSEAHRT